MHVVRYFIAVSLVTATSSAAGAEVMVCRDHTGTLWFTDQPCANAVRVPISTPSVIEGHAPTAAEQQALAALARGPAAKVTGTPHSTTRNRDRACQMARDGLDALRLQRRRGYALSESTALDAREQLLRADYDRYC